MASTTVAQYGLCLKNASKSGYFRFCPGGSQFPKQILLLRHQSLPLAQIIKEMNIYSNNEMAEMLAQSWGSAVHYQQAAKS